MIDLRKTEQKEIRKERIDSRNWKREKVVVRNEARGFSPSFLPEGSQQFSFFPKFAFGASLVLLFALLFYGGIVYKKDIARLAGFERGTVAGAENSNVDLADAKNSSINFLENRVSKVRENISISRVIIRAAIERSTTNDQ